MSVIGNVVWFILGGFLIGFLYIVAGLLLCMTIIGIPFGLRAIQFGLSVMTPFGKETQMRQNTGILTVVFNIIWIILFGWEIAVAHVLSGLLFAITIIGIPFARQHFKLAPVALLPFSYRLQAMSQ